MKWNEVSSSCLSAKRKRRAWTKQVVRVRLLPFVAAPQPKAAGRVGVAFSCRWACRGLWRRTFVRRGVQVCCRTGRPVRARERTCAPPEAFRGIKGGGGDGFSG